MRQVNFDGRDLVANRRALIACDHVVVRDRHQDRVFAEMLAIECDVVMVARLNDCAGNSALGVEKAAVNIFDVSCAAPARHQRTAICAAIFIRKNHGILQYWFSAEFETFAIDHHWHICEFANCVLARIEHGRMSYREILWVRTVDLAEAHLVYFDRGALGRILLISGNAHSVFTGFQTSQKN